MRYFLAWAIFIAAAGLPGPNAAAAGVVWQQPAGRQDAEAPVIERVPNLGVEFQLIDGWSFEPAEDRGDYLVAGRFRLDHDDGQQTTIEIRVYPNTDKAVDVFARDFAAASATAGQDKATRAWLGRRPTVMVEHDAPEQSDDDESEPATQPAEPLLRRSFVARNAKHMYVGSIYSTTADLPAEAIDAVMTTVRFRSAREPMRLIGLTTLPRRLGADSEIEMRLPNTLCRDISQPQADVFTTYNLEQERYELALEVAHRPPAQTPADLAAFVHEQDSDFEQVATDPAVYLSTWQNDGSALNATAFFLDGDRLTSMTWSMPAGLEAEATQRYEEVVRESLETAGHVVDAGR